MPALCGTSQSSNSCGGVLGATARRDTCNSAGSLLRLAPNTGGCEPAARRYSSRRCGTSLRQWRISSRARMASPRGGRRGVTRALGMSPSSRGKCADSAGRSEKCGSPRRGGYGSAGPVPFLKPRPTGSPWTALGVGTSRLPRTLNPSPRPALVRSSASTGAWPSVRPCRRVRCSLRPGSVPHDGAGSATFSAGWRGQSGSNRRVRVKLAIAHLKAKEADTRKDWVEKISTDLARRFDVIRVEDLHITGMTRSAKGTVRQPGRNVRAKAGLNREILRSGWGLLVRRLDAKAPGRLEKVNPAFTSQRCSACRHVAAGSRESQALFRCVACGYACNADVNAARNIAAGHAVTARGGFRDAGPVNREPQLFAS